jgi:hypothetical protein
MLSTATEDCYTVQSIFPSTGSVHGLTATVNFTSEAFTTVLSFLEST